MVGSLVANHAKLPERASECFNSHPPPLSPIPTSQGQHRTPRSGYLTDRLIPRCTPLYCNSRLQCSPVPQSTAADQDSIPLHPFKACVPLSESSCLSIPRHHLVYSVTTRLPFQQSTKIGDRSSSRKQTWQPANPRQMKADGASTPHRIAPGFIFAPSGSRSWSDAFDITVSNLICMSEKHEALATDFCCYAMES